MARSSQSEVLRLARRVVAHPAAVRGWRVLLLVLLTVVAMLALMPVPPRGFDTGWDKMNHLLAFAALAVCACLGQPASARLRRWLLVGLLAYGASIELLQLLVPGREAEWSDLAADALGLLVGATIAGAVLRAALLTQAASNTVGSSGAKP